MKVLVTGASGLLGRTVAQTLIDAGHAVTVMQRRESNLDCEEVRGDITDQVEVEAAVLGQEAVVHLAAKVTPTGSWSEFQAINIEGTKNLVQASQRAGVSRFIYVSSPSVASSGDAHVGVGALPADPSSTGSFYARSKAEAELYLLGVEDDSLSIAAVRPHLVWGPGDEQLIARIVERAEKGMLRLIG